MLTLFETIGLLITVNILRPMLAVNPMMFIENLKYMGLGMLCIIIVMAVIIGVVLVLNKASAAIAAKKAESESEDNK